MKSGYTAPTVDSRAGEIMMTQFTNACMTDIDLDIHDFELCDLKLLFCGYERCHSGHSWGPNMRNHYVFHLILSGKGVFNSGGKVFSLSEGQGFMLFPETPVLYSADANTPWEYIWVGFTGQSAAKMISQTSMSPNLPVMAFMERFDRERELLYSIVNSIKEGGTESIIESYGLFLQFMSHLAREKGIHPENTEQTKTKSSSEHYVEHAKDFIRENLYKDISTSDVADYLGLNRSYFYKIFTEACGKSPSRFITWYRLNTAWHLLQYTNMPVGEISRHVGYNDPAYFTRCFTACYGQPPISVRSAERH
jgi:AraC-like DNA-binding protein